jgi:hypothetical protein
MIDPLGYAWVGRLQTPYGFAVFKEDMAMVFSIIRFSSRKKIGIVI